MNAYIAEQIAAIIKHLFDMEIMPEVTRPEPEFGDAATNVAMQLAGKLQKNPREIAEQIAETLRENNEFTEVSIAGPGFINLRVSDSLIAKSIDKPVEQKNRTGQTAAIETNNPNPFKDLHIGHAYNCIVADTIANLLETGGAKTHRVSYHGDVGLHVGKSMWAILQFVDGDAAKLDEIAEQDRPTFLSEKYVEGAKAYENDEAAKQEIDELAKQSFSQNDPLFKNVYEMCRAWSFDYFAQIIKKLGSQNVEKRYLESEADTKGAETVHKHTGEIFEESDGAVIFPGEKYNLHTQVFVSSRGTGLYPARDLGLMQLKQNDFSPDKSFIVTAEEQKAYFNVVIKAAELTLPELKDVTENISTGTVKLSTGKMKSRTGEILNIEWIFEQLKTAAKERGGADENVIIGALRYAFLKVRVGGDVVFDVNESLSIEGNSGPYLQYAHARARSILAKKYNYTTKHNFPGINPGKDKNVVFDSFERELALKLAEYPEILRRATSELLPHVICTYLYELAQTFNRFYEQSRVIGDTREDVRLQLVLRYADILKNGLGVLGIPSPEKL